MGEIYNTGDCVKVKANNHTVSTSSLLNTIGETFLVDRIRCENYPFSLYGAPNCFYRAEDLERGEDCMEYRPVELWPTTTTTTQENKTDDYGDDYSAAHRI